MITIPPAIEVVERNGPGHPDTLAGKNPVSHVGKIYNVIAALVDRGDRGGQGGGGDAGLHDRLACEPPNHPQRQARRGWRPECGACPGVEDRGHTGLLAGEHR